MARRSLFLLLAMLAVSSVVGARPPASSASPTQEAPLPAREWWLQDETTDQVGSVRDGSFAAALWSLTLGSGVIVAVVDTGIDARQPDLSTHLWQNPNPLPGGVDQEGVSFLPKLLSPPNLLASTMSGTSMAAPMVSGVAALLFALYPQATAADVAAALCAGVRPEPALARLTRCGGTLDALAAARMLGAALGQPQPEIP